VRTQETVPPGKLRPGLPPDLQTICLKCLEKEPGRRYATAQALAEDLGRFLRGEPIHARPVSRPERLRKWVRRQPALAGLLAVSGLAVSGLLVGLWLHTARLSEQVRLAEANAHEAREQRERADANYRQVRTTIHRMLDRLKDDRLADVPRAAELRHDLREEALSFFQSIPKGEESPDPTVRLDVALAYSLIGEIQLVEGRHIPALESCERARRLLEGLVAAYPDEVEYRMQLANVQFQLAVVATRLDRADDALAWLQQALAVREELARSHPENDTWQANLAETYDHIGFASLGKREPAVVEANWLRGLAIWEQLVRDHPQVAKYRLGLALDYVNLGLFDVGQDRPAEVEVKFRKAESVLTALVHDHPDDIHARALLGDLYDNSAGVLLRAGKNEAALDRYTQSILTLETALQMEPRFRTAQIRLARVLASRALVSVLLKRDTDAEKDWRRALEQGALLQSDKQYVDHGNLVERSVLLARCGAHALAAAGARALAARTGVAEAELYQLAVAWSLSIPAVRADTKLPATEQDRLAEEYGSHAVALLRKLQAAGYFQDAGRAEKLKTGGELGPLRDRADFRKLLQEVASSKQR
jgi:serine/threonine-protein kinase